MRNIFISFLLLLLLNSVAIAQSVEQEFKTKLAQQSDNNKTIVAEFTQIKSVPGIKKEVESVGDFYYDNSGAMAMIYSDPVGDKVVMNGDDFTIVVGGKVNSSTASSNPMMAQISYMMQASMSGNVANLGRGWVLDVQKNEEQYCVTITPNDRRIKKYIAQMTMFFDGLDMTLDTLRIDESTGGYTSYAFTQKKINAAIDNQIFVCSSK